MHVNMICVLASIFVELLVTTQFGPVNAQQGSISVSAGNPLEAAAGIATQIASDVAAGANMGSIGFGVADKMKSMQQGSIGFPAGNPIAAVAGITTQIGSDMAAKTSQTVGEMAQVAANAGSRGFDVGKTMMNAFGRGAGLTATSISRQFTMDQQASRDYNAMPLAQNRGQTATNRPMAPITITGK